MTSIEVVHRPAPHQNLVKSSSTSRIPLQPRSGNATGSFNSSTDVYTSKDMAALNRLSHMESSNNENNKRLTTSNTEGESNQQASLRSASVPRPSSTRSATSSSSLPSSSKLDEDSVIIEEKRRKVNGDGYTVHRYLRGRLLGKGGFAKVYLCTALDTNKAYAIKIVPKANLVKARARQKLQAEIKIHRTLKHKNVCEYKHFFEDRQNCYILLELCHNQSMNEMIKRRKRLTEPEAVYLMDQLVDSVQYLHKELVIHRDLKLGNLFLDRNMNIKVGDLGLATRLETAEEKRKTICGTPNYIAPEVIQGDRATRGHSFEVDIWSMGVILYTILVGKPPYEAKDVKATYQRILANEYSFPRGSSSFAISDHAKSLIRAMLQSKPADRPTLDQVAKHPFFTTSLAPRSLPSFVTHSAPEWEVNEFGELALSSKGGSLSNNHNNTFGGVGKSSKLPRSNSASTRQPFATRDVNVDPNSNNVDRKVASKQSRDIMEGAVKNALSAVMNIGTKTAAPSATASGFQVFDETKSEVANETEALVARTAALSIQGTPSVSTSAALPKNLKSPPATAAVLDQDNLILINMIERIDTVMEVTAKRQYDKVAPDSPSLTAFSSGGPTTWVARYVDYTSKYGLGYLLNDGCSGVYFNDSTKTVLEAVGDNFLYIERRKTAGDVRRGDPVVAPHTLDVYPGDLQKKVTLLKHFRNYLIEQQKKSDGDDDLFSKSTRGRREMVYLKKWVRTKHAIFFRMSDQTVQIVFYDHTEILLTPDERHITHVDKQGNRSTYYLTDELVGYNTEIAKRLKYTKEILQQLISTHKR